MKVRCIRSFSGLGPDDNRVHYAVNDEFELPKGVDWLQAGLVEPIEKQPETTARAKPKRRTTRKKTSGPQS